MKWMAAPMAWAIILSTLIGGIRLYNVTELSTKPACHDQDNVVAKASFEACMSIWHTSRRQCRDDAAALACKRWGRP